MSGAGLRIGVDLGGTKIEVACLDARGHGRLRRRVATPRDDYAATVAAIASLVAGAERELGATGTIGVGIPGALSLRDGGAAVPGKLTRATLVARVLELQKTKDRPVVIAADRNVKYDEVVGLLGALHAQGVKRVGLVAKEGG